MLKAKNGEVLWKDLRKKKRNQVVKSFCLRAPCVVRNCEKYGNQIKINLLKQSICGWPYVIVWWTEETEWHIRNTTKTGTELQLN